MDTTMLDSVKNVRALVTQAWSTEEPVLVLDGQDECLVAMQPSVFERLLFDSHLLNCSERGEAGV